MLFFYLLHLRGKPSDQHRLIILFSLHTIWLPRHTYHSTIQYNTWFWKPRNKNRLSCARTGPPIFTRPSSYPSEQEHLLLSHFWPSKAQIKSHFLQLLKLPVICFLWGNALMAESEEELNSLLMKVKEESEKVGLKLSIQNTKIVASSPIISWQKMGKQWK